MASFCRAAGEKGTRPASSVPTTPINGGCTHHAGAHSCRRHRLPCSGDAWGLELPPQKRPERRRGSSGEVSEWLKEHAWKVCKRLNRASGVRIPLSPPVCRCSEGPSRVSFAGGVGEGVRTPVGSTDGASRLHGEAARRARRAAPSESPSLRQFERRELTQRLWWPRRPLATLGRKPRQGRKAATVSIDAGAEVSRRGRLLPIT